MNVTIGQTTYRSLHDAADAYKTNVSTLAHYRKKIKNCQRLERFLVLNQLQQLLVNPDISDKTADSIYKMMLRQLASAQGVVDQAAPAAKKTSQQRPLKPAYAYDTSVTLPESVAQQALEYSEIHQLTRHQFAEQVIHWAHTHLDDIRKYFDRSRNVNPQTLKFPLSAESKQLLDEDQSLLHSRKRTPYVRAAIIAFLNTHN